MVDHENSVDNEPASANKTTEAEKEDDDEEHLFKWKPLRKTLTDKEMLSQAILFLGAANDTTSLNLIFLSYNLATHPECQDKLCEEVDRVLEKYVSLIYMKKNYFILY